MKEACCRSCDEGTTCRVVAPADMRVSSDALHTKKGSSMSRKQIQARWHTIRGGFLLAVACIFSPCCIPLLVPFGFALLAGTPVAVWLTQYLGWVYGGLTLISTVSLGLGLYWMRQNSRLTSPGSHDGWRNSERCVPKAGEKRCKEQH